MKKILLPLLFSISILTAQAQDPVYSMFWMNDINLNPAFVGNNEGLNINCLNRLEWTKVISHFNSYSFSGSLEAEKLYGGIGILASYSDEGEGALSTTQLGLVYSYSLPVSENGLVSAGFQGDYALKKVNDYNKLVYSSQLDPVLGGIPVGATPLLNEQTSYFNADFGLVYDQLFIGHKFKELILGTSFHNMLPSDVTLYGFNNPLPKRYTVHSSAFFGSKKKSNENSIRYNPYFVYEFASSRNEIINSYLLLGANLELFPVELGVGYRYSRKNTDALIFNLNYSFQRDKDENSIVFGVSYDVTLSSLSNSYSGGTVEFGIKFINDGISMLKAKRSSLEHLDNCRRFKSKRKRLRHGNMPHVV